MAPADAMDADALARELREENASLRREIEALRERSATREIEFRQELRALAAQCASLAAAAAVTSASAAATTEATQTEATVSADAHGGEWCVGGGHGVGGRPRRSARAPPTAWEVPNAWPMGAENADRASARSGEVSDRVRDAVEEEARRRGRGRRGVDADAFVGELSSFFFKTAKHEAPVWESKKSTKSNDIDATSILRSARDGASEDDVDADAFGASSRPARETDPFDRSRGRPASSLDVEDEREADLTDSLRDDDDLVDALLRGGRDGERAAETLASRLRAVGFADS